jgi:DNA-binding HxlR family transcriptional regulator
VWPNALDGEGRPSGWLGALGLARWRTWNPARARAKIADALNGGATVEELMSATGMPRATLSRHLRAMEQLGEATRERGTNPAHADIWATPMNANIRMRCSSCVLRRPQPCAESEQRKASMCRAFRFYGSDGTRTRDLRRDRPAL